MRTRILAAAAALLAAASARGQEVVVRGTVVGADGQPAAGVEVADFWSGTRDAMKAFNGTKTDADGRYALKLQPWMTEASVLALDADRKLGGLVTVKPKEARDVPPIKLGPLVRVVGRFERQELGKRPPWTNVYVNTSRQARLLQSMSQAAEFGFILPPGKYQFHGYGTDVKGVRREVEVPADKPELDLGAIELPATEIAKH